jgi:RHS repeat-associated protein
MVNRVYAMNGQLLYERDLTTNRVTQHVYFDGKPIAMIRNGVRSYVPTDHLGRPELLVDDTAAANTVWKATLGPFDRERITVDTIGGYHLGFPGQYHDQETGFAYNINRDYDPSTGRYLQPDPIGDKWHNPHWDHHPRNAPNSGWVNIPHGGLPPVKTP